MVKPNLVNLNSGEKIVFEDVEELVEYIVEVVCEDRDSEDAIVEILNGRNFEYGIEWIVE